MNIQTLKITRKVGLIDMFKDLGFKVGVEVGTDHGGYARDICSRFPEVKLYTIDPWTAYTEGDEVKSQAEVDQIYEEAKALLAPFPNCEIIRKTSMEAVKDFAPESIDFVFIDGNHEYEYVLEDITEWSKIVRSGGIVCGHDYKIDPSRKYGVVEAVNEYAGQHGIYDLTILRKGSYVDCWMWRKK